MDRHDLPSVHGAADVLTAGSAAEVAELCRSLASDAGGPIEIEWAFEDGAPFLLQSRPVTVVPIEPAERPPAGQTFVREPRFDGPINSLSFTAWMPRHGRAFTHTFARSGLPIETLDNRRYLGRIHTRAEESEPERDDRRGPCRSPLRRRWPCAHHGRGPLRPRGRAVYIPIGRLWIFVEEQLGWSMHDIFTLVQGRSGATTAHGATLGRRSATDRPDRTRASAPSSATGG